MLKATSLTAILIVLPLYFWRIFYPVTDWAIISLAFLAAVTFIGIFFSSASLFKAQMKVAVRSTSPHKKWFTGRLRAVFKAVAFATFATLILGWQAVTVPTEVAIALILLCVFASSTTFLSERFLENHLTAPFARVSGAYFGTAVATIVFLPVLVWINLSMVSYPAEFKTHSWSQLILIGQRELPERRGWISELLSVFYVLEYSKLWLVIQLGTSRWVAILYSLDTALGGLILARASAVLSNSLRYLTGDQRN